MATSFPRNNIPDVTTKFVLVVDDDVDIRETVTGVLQDEGYEVATAGNGEEALAYLQSPGAKRPHLILLDLMMPIMSGSEFRAAQEADPSLSAIPVVLVSASGDVVARADSMRVAGVVRKPLSLDILIDNVERYADKRSN